MASPRKKPTDDTCAARPACCDRERVLEAAESVVLAKGIGALTLLAVAQEAKLSKSGLLHHFSSKDALLDALVTRTIDCWEADVDAAVANTSPGPGRIARAILSTCLSSTRTWTETQRRSSQVLVAAVVQHPKHAEALRTAHRRILGRIAKDGLPPGVGEAIDLAANGMWFTWLLGLTEWTPARIAAVRSALERLLKQESAAPRPSARRPRPRTTVRKK
jgi:AcrR family transcriptional regulator